MYVRFSKEKRSFKPEKRQKEKYTVGYTYYGDPLL
jgi:hypothetical protein